MGKKEGGTTMTIEKLYQWAKARNAEDMTLHVDTCHALHSGLVVEDELVIVKAPVIKRVVIQK